MNVEKKTNPDGKNVRVFPSTRIRINVLAAEEDCSAAVVIEAAISLLEDQRQEEKNGRQTFETVKIYCGVCESVDYEGEDALITTLPLDKLNSDDPAATVTCKRCADRLEHDFALLNIPS